MALGDIVLLKDRTPLGPFTRRQIQDGLSRGEFSAQDLAHTPGLTDWLPLLEVLHHLDREVVHLPRTREGLGFPPVPSDASRYAPPEVAPVQPPVREPSSLPPTPDPAPEEVRKFACAATPPDLPPIQIVSSGPPSLPIADRDPEVRRAGESALLSIRDLVAGDLEKKARAGAFSGTAAEAVDRVLTRFVPVVKWKVIGPYPRTTAQVFFGEKTIDFSRPHVGAEGRELAWTDRPGDGETGRVVLDDLKGNGGDRGGFGYDLNGSPDLAAFAFAEIESDRDRPALLLFGSSGSLVATLNENWILDYNNLAGRPFVADSNRVRVQLKQGKNRLLVRTRQGIGSWQFSVQVSEPSESLFATRPGKISLEELRGFAASHDGDASRGRALFFDPRGIGCVKCHAAGGQGTAKVGPDLTGLALKYDRAEIIRSVLEPSNRIATGYQPVLVAKADGSVLTGLLRSETDSQLELIDANAKVARVNKAEIEDRRVGDVSLMPVGLVDTLAKQEFADLIAYLMSLKAATKPAEAEKTRR